MHLIYQRWKYKAPVNIASSPIYDSFQADVMVPYMPGMDPNFKDIRFSASGRKLPYYIKNYTPGVSAFVLVSLPIYASKAYLYYGNSNAESESNPSAVYDLYDPVDAGVINSTIWSGITSGIEDAVDDGTGNYVLQLNGNAGSAALTSIKNFSFPIIMEGRLQIKAVNASGFIQGGARFSYNGTTTGYIFCLLDDSSGGNVNAKGTCLSTSGVVVSSQRVAYSLDTWYDFSLSMKYQSGVNSRGIEFILNGVDLTYDSSTTNTPGTIGISCGNGYGKIWYDDIRVRKYSVTPPILTLGKAVRNYDSVYYAGNIIDDINSGLGLKGAFGISQPPITADSILGLHPKFSEVMPPIDAGNAEIWIHNRINIASFINPYEVEIKNTQAYSSLSKLNPINQSSIGLSPAVLQVEKISLSSSLGVSPGGGQTAGKITKINAVIKHGGRYNSLSTLSEEGGQIGNIASYMNLERYSYNADLGLEGTFQGKRDFIGIHTGIEFSKRLRFTFERTIIKTPGQLKVTPWAQYKSPFPEIGAYLGLSPQNYPIKKKYFLIDYNVRSVNIGKTVSDALWTLEAEFAGTDCPSEFEGLNHSAVDYQGDINHLFTGVTPESSPSLSNSEASSRITAYDYGYYLSKQYLPDDCLTINLQGSITTWRDWIQHLLKGTGITGYKIAVSEMPDVTFSFTGKTTRRQAIDAISDYCNCIFEVSFFNHGTPTAPIWVTGAYWIPISDLDSFTQGLDLPDPKIFSWPNPYMATLPEVSGNPEEKINRVRIRGSDGTNNYSCTLETAEVTNGDDIARELYEDQEENKSLVSQEAVNSRAAELLAYYVNPPYQVTARMIMRYDLRLYQKIKFDYTFPEQLSSLTDGIKGGVTWLRITEINYHCEAGNNYVEFKAISDTETAVLMAAQGEGSYTLFDNIETVSKLLTTNP